MTTQHADPNRHLKPGGYLEQVEISIEVHRIFISLSSIWFVGDSGALMRLPLLIEGGYLHSSCSKVQANPSRVQMKSDDGTLKPDNPLVTFGNVGFLELFLHV
jgi:hypothetical protein